MIAITGNTSVVLAALTLVGCASHANQARIDACYAQNPEPSTLTTGYGLLNQLVFNRIVENDVHAQWRHTIDACMQGPWANPQPVIPAVVPVAMLWLMCPLGQPVRTSLGYKTHEDGVWMGHALLSKED